MGEMIKKIMKGLFCNDGKDVISHTKFWNNAGLIVFSGMFIYLGIYKEIPEWLGWMYVFMITPSRLLNKIIALRWGINPSDKDNQKGEEK